MSAKQNSVLRVGWRGTQNSPGLRGGGGGGSPAQPLLLGTGTPDSEELQYHVRFLAPLIMLLTRDKDETRKRDIRVTLPAAFSPCVGRPVDFGLGLRNVWIPRSPSSLPLATTTRGSAFRPSAVLREPVHSVPCVVGIQKLYSYQLADFEEKDGLALVTAIASA